MPLCSKFTSLILIGFAAILSCAAQQSIASYAIGSVYGTTPYVSISIPGANTASIGINEYNVAHFDDQQTRIVSFNRKGIGSITKTTSLEKSVFKVILNDSKWDVVEVAFADAPGAIASEINKELARRSTSYSSNGNGSVLISTGIPARKSTVLILENDSLDASCSAIAQVVKGALVDQFELLERAELEGLIDEQKLSMSGLVSEEESIEAGRILGAQFASRLSCTGLDGQYLVTLEFINCETSAIEGVLTVSAANIAGVAQLIQGELQSN